MPFPMFFELRLRWVFVCRAMAMLVLLCGKTLAALPPAPPAEVGLDPAVLARIGPVIDEALAAGKMPGCVILVTRHGKTAFFEGLWAQAFEPTCEPMLTDTVFDLPH